MHRSTYSLPSASVNLHPCPSLKKRGYGLIALTGLETPAGVRPVAASYSFSDFSVVIPSPQGTRHFFGVICDNHVRTCTFDAQQRFRHDAFLVNPSVGSGRFDHGIFARYLIRRKRKIESVSGFPDNVEVGSGRFDHNHVRTFGDIHFDFAHGFLSVSARHLISGAVSFSGRGAGNIPERAVVCAVEFGAVCHDGSIFEPGIVQCKPYRRNLAVHHSAGCDYVRTRFRLGYSGFAVKFDCFIVHYISGIVQNTAVTVIRILAQAQIGDDQKIGIFFDSGYCFLHYSFFFVCAAAAGVFVGRYAEYENRTDSAFLNPGTYAVVIFQRMGFHSGHGCRRHGFGNVRIEKHRENQFVRVQSCFRNKVSDFFALSEPSEAYFRIHHFKSPSPNSSVAADRTSVLPSREASLRLA